LRVSLAIFLILLRFNEGQFFFFDPFSIDF
jgi:hypothetical protein